METAADTREYAKSPVEKHPLIGIPGTAANLRFLAIHAAGVTDPRQAEVVADLVMV